MMKGLKPYPAYKDPKVPWLGNIPGHWEVLPGRAVFREINDRGYPDEQMLSVTITRGVLRQADLLTEGSKKDSSNEDKSKYKLVRRVTWYQQDESLAGSCGCFSLPGDCQSSLHRPATEKF